MTQHERRAEQSMAPQQDGIHETAIKTVDSAEASFKTLVGQPDLIVDAPHAVFTALKDFRSSVEANFSDDLRKAHKIRAGSRLWEAHSSVNGRLRQRLKELRSDDTKPVQTRKHIKAYLQFLKEAQIWYRGFVSLLNETYGPIKGLHGIAGFSSSATPVTHDESLVKRADDYCYFALVYLGDLARWRTSESLDKEPVWGPAVGYYELAIAIKPTSGIAWRQRSLVEIAQKDHFRFVYDLYRSIALEEPCPNPMNDLAVEMRSLQKRWGTSEFSAATKLSGLPGARNVFIAWFLRLHSLSYNADNVSNREELEREVSSRMQTLYTFKECSPTLLKASLINMGASWVALKRLENDDKDDRPLRAFWLFIKMSMDTFEALLKQFVTALGNQIATIDVCSVRDGRDTSGFRELPLGLLPAIRIHSKWLLTNYMYLLPSNINERLKEHAGRLWATFNDCLNVLALVFPTTSLPVLGYKLEEDKEVMGYLPLQPNENVLGPEPSKSRDLHSDGKRMSTDNEALARIYDLQFDGLRLAATGRTPMTFADGRFQCSGTSEFSGLVQRLAASRAKATTTITTTTNGGLSTTSRTPSRREPSRPTSIARLDPPIQLNTARKLDTTEAQDDDLNRMVDDLVGPDDSPQPPPRSRSTVNLTGFDTPRERPMSFTPTTLATPTQAGKPERFSSVANKSYTSGMHSPLLFGNGGVWSVGPKSSTSNQTPPNGQSLVER